ncbi:MAG: adenosine deaminase family protein, partial [Exilispira sp.]
MKWYNDEFIRKIPKTDLHLHLDGSLRIITLIELAKQQRIELPSYTKEGLEELVFKKSYNNLDEYLKGFAYTCA